MGNQADVRQTMAFTKLANRKAGAGEASGAIDMSEYDVWTIFRALRDARAHFGLRPGHIQSLQAMLSFLKPGQGNTVFASNYEICRRTGGIDERTLRRHINRFIELGFMTRNSSPNHKRYRVRSAEGQCISFGLSLKPLLDRAEELIAVAQELEDMRRNLVFLRKKILYRLAQLEERNPESTVPDDVRKTLRRKLSIQEHLDLLAVADAELNLMSTAVDNPETIIVSANDGQTVRHQSKSEERKKDTREETSEEPSVGALVSTCKQATSFSTDTLQNWNDVERHAQTLAPMMGIDPAIYEHATNAVGRRKAASAIFIMLEIGKNIRNFAAYFRSITLGRRAGQFDPASLLRRIPQSNAAIA